MDEGNGLARDYLKAPYSRVLIPDAETGTYTAKIAEFPGCVAQGDTPEEAYRNLEAAAESWIEEVLGMGQRVPEPATGNQYSGRVALRLPKSLHRNAAQLAEREGISLNQFLVSTIAERVGSGNLYERLTEKLAQRSVQVATQTAIGNIVKLWGASQDAMEVHPVKDKPPTRPGRTRVVTRPGSAGVINVGPHSAANLEAMLVEFG